MDVTPYSCMAKSELEQQYIAVLAEYRRCQAQGLKLNMARGKPSKAQLDLVSGILTAVQSPEEPKLMLDIAKEHDLFLICDEVYREFTYGGEPLTSALQYPGYEDNVIVIDSVSKRFSACGARIGLLISKNREFMQQAMKWCQCRLCASTTDQVAAAALYSVDKDYFAAVREEYKLRRDTLLAKLSQIPGVVCKEPKGAFYVMAALPVDDADKFQLWLLNEFEDHGETVMFSCGEPFYATPGKGLNEVRMAYVINKEDIARAMDILAVAIRKYNETH